MLIFRSSLSELIINLTLIKGIILIKDSEFITGSN